MEVLTADSRVVIYGAGKIGRRIFDLCQDRGIEVVQVWDNYPEKVVAFHRRDLVRRPPDLSGGRTAATHGLDHTTVVVTAFSPNMAAGMAKPLLDKGFARVVYDRSEISAILIDHCRWLNAAGRFDFRLADCFICPARRDERIECDLFNASLGMPDHDAGQGVTLPVLGFLLTTKCNLTCVGCNHLRDHFEKAHNVDFQADRILEDLTKLVNAVDWVKSLVIVGGEALVHPEFERILREVLALPKIGFVHIITNGTVIPKRDRVFELFAHPRIVVEISGYGNEPGHLRVEKRSQFFRKLEEHHVLYRYDEATQWIDFGDFHERPFTPEVWRRVYSTCCFVSNDLFDGQLHKCSRSAYGLMLGKIPEYAGDFVDVRAAAPGDLKDRIRTFLQTVPQVCRHCNGTTMKTMPAGVQVVRMYRRASGAAAASHQVVSS